MFSPIFAPRRSRTAGLRKPRVPLRILLALTAVLGVGRLCVCALPAGLSGTAFTYQGHLYNGTNAASGSFELVFALCDAATGGQAIGSPITNSLTFTNGSFTALLDFGNVISNHPVWLEIAVRTKSTDFVTLAPRQALTPSPVALYALNAATVAATGLPSMVVTNGQTEVNLTGTFSGDGSRLTNVAGMAVGVPVTNGTSYSQKLTYPGAVSSISVGSHLLSGSPNWTMLRFGPETTNNWADLRSGLLWGRGASYWGGAELYNWPDHGGVSGVGNELVIASSGKIALGTGMAANHIARGLQIGIGTDTYMYLQGAQNISKDTNVLTSPSCAFGAVAASGGHYTGSGTIEGLVDLPAIQLWPTGTNGQGEWRFWDYLKVGVGSFNYSNSVTRAALGVGPYDTNGYFTLRGTVNCTDLVVSNALTTNLTIGGVTLCITNGLIRRVY